MQARPDFDEKGIRREQERSAAERRERNALAIAEVVGREPTTPSRTPADICKRLRDRGICNN